MVVHHKFPQIFTDFFNYPLCVNLSNPWCIYLLLHRLKPFYHLQDSISLNHFFPILFYNQALYVV